MPAAEYKEFPTLRPKARVDFGPEWVVGWSSLTGGSPQDNDFMSRRMISRPEEIDATTVGQG